jgi:aspartyl-tRNA(Asn)/glutamyl-tRNA(Gln) amidotransferase subunit B
VQRQIEAYGNKERVVQETRLWDTVKGETRSLRSKEEANDYRYFPDPDLLPVELDTSFIEAVRATLPELPDQKAARFVSQYALTAYDAGVLTASRELAQYYEEVVRAAPRDPKLAANWVMGELAAALNKDNLDVTSGKLSAARLAGLLMRISDQTISGKIAKEVFEAMWSGGDSADIVIESKGLRQITDSTAIEQAIDAVMAKNPGQLADYRAGKDKLFGFFVGQVMKATAGKANPAQLNELLRKKLPG